LLALSVAFVGLAGAGALAQGFEPDAVESSLFARDLDEAVGRTIHPTASPGCWTRLDLSCSPQYLKASVYFAVAAFLSNCARNSAVDLYNHLRGRPVCRALSDLPSFRAAVREFVGRPSVAAAMALGAWPVRKGWRLKNKMIQEHFWVYARCAAVGELTVQGYRCLAPGRWTYVNRSPWLVCVQVVAMCFHLSSHTRALRTGRRHYVLVTEFAADLMYVGIRLAAGGSAALGSLKDDGVFALITSVLPLLLGGSEIRGLFKRLLGGHHGGQDSGPRVGRRWFLFVQVLACSVAASSVVLSGVKAEYDCGDEVAAGLPPGTTCMATTFAYLSDPPCECAAFSVAGIGMLDCSSPVDFDAQLAPVFTKYLGPAVVLHVAAFKSCAPGQETFQRISTLPYLRVLTLEAVEQSTLSSALGEVAGLQTLVLERPLGLQKLDNGVVSRMSRLQQFVCAGCFDLDPVQEVPTALLELQRLREAQINGAPVCDYMPSDPRLACRAPGPPCGAIPGTLVGFVGERLQLQVAAATGANGANASEATAEGGEVNSAVQPNLVAAPETFCATSCTTAAARVVAVDLEAPFGSLGPGDLALVLAGTFGEGFSEEDTECMAGTTELGLAEGMLLLTGVSTCEECSIFAEMTKSQAERQAALEQAERVFPASCAGNLMTPALLDSCDHIATASSECTVTCSIAQAFKASDRDRNGVLNTSELDAMTTSVGYSLEPGIFMQCLLEGTKCAVMTASGPVADLASIMLVASAMAGNPTTCESCT